MRTNPETEKKKRSNEDEAEIKMKNLGQPFSRVRVPVRKLLRSATDFDDGQMWVYKRGQEPNKKKGWPGAGGRGQKLLQTLVFFLTNRRREIPDRPTDRPPESGGEAAAAAAF